MTSTISPNQRWHIQCNTHATSDTSPSLLVVFDDAKYLFECPENTTRAFVQDRISFKKLQHVFLNSAVNIQSTSGLGGLLLSLGERDGAEMNVYGPEGLSHLLASMRYHTRRSKLNLNVNELETSGAHSQNGVQIFQDTNVTVRAFPVSPDSPSSAQKGPRKRGRSRSASPAPSLSKRSHVDFNAPDGIDSSPAGSDSEINADCRDDTVNIKLDWHGRGFEPRLLQGSQAKQWRMMIIEDMFRRGKAPPCQPNDPTSQQGKTSWLPSPAWNNSPLPYAATHPTALSYLVVGPMVRGKFRADKAKALGISPGPDFGRLSKGEAITLPDGQVISPSMCHDAGADASAFMVISCPNAGYISGLLDSHLSESLPKNVNLKFAFHMLGPNVDTDPKYLSWLSEFPAHCQHVISSPASSTNRISFASAALLQSRLSKLDPTVFKVPDYQLTPNGRLVDSLSSERWKALEIGEVFTMNGKPPEGLNTTRLRHFDFDESSRELLAEAEARLNGRTPESLSHSKQVWDEYSRSVIEAQARIAVQESRRAAERHSRPGAEILVTALGTGSAMPSKYRNVSATLLQLNSEQAILLDVGEGTSGQLARHFGHQYSDVLKSLRLVFISHMHADHHSGLAHLLKQRRLKMTSGPTLYIACPPQVEIYLRDISRLDDLGLERQGSKVVFINNNYLLPDQRDDKRQQGLYTSLGLKKLETVLVDHRARCYGLVVEGRNGWKIAYSGDTMPCQALVAAGRNASLLIHEATIEDDMPEVAELKGHSTFSQALEVARQMDAENCLLTHFSQRYPKFPPLSDENEQSGGPEIAVAFDLMSIKVGDIWKAKHFTKPLQLLFSEWEGDDSADASVATNLGGEVRAQRAATAAKKAKGRNKQNDTQRT